MAIETGAGPAVRAQPDLAFHGDRELAAGLTDLAVNVRPGPPPPWLRAAIRDAVDDLAAYPDPAAATAAVARRHARPESEVLVTAGAAEAFTLIARAFRPRHAVVVHPQFTEPEAALLAAGHEVGRVILEPDFQLDPRRIPARADLVVIGNPTNPTAVLHPAAVLAGLARPGRTLVVDEAFADCGPGEPESLAAARDLPGLIVVRSLTKTWGLAGLRAGYLLAGPGHVRALARPRPPWAVSGPALAAVVACCTPRALAEARAWAAAMGAERDRWAAALARLPGIRLTPHSQASFLLFECSLPSLPVPAGAVPHPGPVAGPRVRERLRQAGFAVRRGDTFPGLGPDWLRVAVRDRATNDRFTAALAAVLGTLEEVTQ
ncbi:MAG TPA: Rv2231c family pyridoxal phosphate-dependent protein CobC [Streptosporangiaceae bacterium]